MWIEINIIIVVISLLLHTSTFCISLTFMWYSLHINILTNFCSSTMPSLWKQSTTYCKQHGTVYYFTQLSVQIREVSGNISILLNDREFWLILLFRDWSRRAFLDGTSEWVHRKCLTTVYSGSLWCHNENADFCVKLLLGLASLVCIFFDVTIYPPHFAHSLLRWTTPWTFLCDKIQFRVKFPMI